MNTSAPALHPMASPSLPRRSSVLQSLFGSAVSASLSVIMGITLVFVVPQVFSWAVLHGAFSGGPEACEHGGACWTFLRQKMPFILFGIYPPAQRWRPTVAIVLIFALSLWSLPVSHWRRSTLVLWIVGMIVALLLMAGGVLELAPVPPASWGGLPITLLLTVLSIGLGFPLAVALALGRQAAAPVPRLLSVILIEGVRGLPLLSLLFIASILLPLMLPAALTLDKFTRALAALTLFAAAYIAEVLRGGLQGIDRGQGEAARALGLTWLQMTRLIILPQALRKVIPPLTNTAVVIVKNTSLVLVVGLFDLLSSGRAAAADPQWPAPYTETYLLVAAIYFVICFGLSRYSHHLERSFQSGLLS